MNTLALSPYSDTVIDAELKANGFNSLEEFAHHILIENRDELEHKDPGALSKITGVSDKVIRALKVSARWRSVVDRLITLDEVDYSATRKNIRYINQMVTKDGVKEADQLRAYMIVEQQKGTKVPEVQQVNNHNRVEFVFTQLESSKEFLSHAVGHSEESANRTLTEGDPGFAPPVSRRQQLSNGPAPLAGLPPAVSQASPRTLPNAEATTLLVGFKPAGLSPVPGVANTGPAEPEQVEDGEGE